MPDVIVARIEAVETHPDEGLDRLSVVTVLGKTAIAGKLEDGSFRYNVGNLAVFLPVGTIIPLALLEKQGFYWDAEKNRGLLKGNKRNRVGEVTRGNVTSEGILFPVTVSGRGYKVVENASGNETVVLEGDILNNFYGIDV